MYLQPASVEEELQEGEDGNIKVEVVTLVGPTWVKKLTTNQTGEEKGVDSKSDDLKREKKEREVVIRVMWFLQLDSRKQQLPGECLSLSL